MFQRLWLRPVFAATVVLNLLSSDLFAVGHPDPLLDLETPTDFRRTVVEVLRLIPGDGAIPTPFGLLTPEFGTGTSVLTRITGLSLYLNNKVILTAGRLQPVVGTLASTPVFVRDVESGEVLPTLFMRFPESDVDLGLLVTAKLMPTPFGMEVSDQLPVSDEILELVGYGNESRPHGIRPQSQRRVGSVRTVSRDPTSPAEFEWQAFPYFAEHGDSGGPLFSKKG